MKDCLWRRRRNSAAIDDLPTAAVRNCFGHASAYKCIADVTLFERPCRIQPAQLLQVSAANNDLCTFVETCRRISYGQYLTCAANDLINAGKFVGGQCTRSFGHDYICAQAAKVATQ